MANSKANQQQFDIESKDANEHLYSNSNILPLEIEDGKADITKKSTTPTSARIPSSEATPRKSVLRRHWGKFTCLGITLIFGILLAILIPLLWFHMPTATILSESTLRIDGLNGADMNVVVGIHNPNRYAIAFENLFVDIYNKENVHIGQVVHPGRVRIRPRRTGKLNANAKMQASLLTFIQMGIGCLEHDNMTNVRIKGSVDALLFGKRLKQAFGPMQQKTQCLASNVSLGTGGNAGNQDPGIGNGQIINQIGNAINEGINDIFGNGGRGNGGANNGANGGANDGARGAGNGNVDRPGA